MEPGKSQGFDTSVAPFSSSLINCRLSKLFCGIWTPDALIHLFIVDDYSRFTWVKFLASKDEALDFIIKFLKMIQVRLNATVRNIHTNNRTEFVNQTLQEYYEQVGISHETSVARTLQQNGVVERQNHTLVEVARTIKPDLSYLHVFGALCYPNNDSENLGKLQAKADIVFDEFFSPPASVASPVPAVEAPAPVESTDTPSSTTVDQDAPSPSTSQSTQQSQSQEIPLCAEEESHDLEVAHMSNDPYFGILIPKDTVTAARRTLQRTCLDLVNAVSKTGNPNGRPPLD
ncbi:retrovirus-related pol polyprotein from transposon TNT 1-94 [Tanacetum coccineum]